MRNEDMKSALQYNASTLVAFLRACAKQKDLCKGSRIHAEIIKRGLLPKNLCVGITLVTMYAKCGALTKAQEVFDELPDRGVVSWTALIAGYAQNGHGEQALNCFEEMQNEGLSPDMVTFVCILKACGNIGAIDKGKEIHARIVREGLLLKKNALVGNALVDMYARCGALEKAQEVFGELPNRDVVSWTALIAGYVQHGHGKEALNCFDQMQCEGLSPDTVTFVCVLKACATTGASDKGQEIHADIIREGLLEKDITVGTGLVDMYAKFGALAKAHNVFDELPARNVVTWNALMAGYAQHGQGNEVLNCFEEMQCEGLAPDPVTFVCVLKACGSIGAADKGQQIHSFIAREGLLKKNILVGSTLVDMYAKCGALTKAKEVFDELPVRNLVTWTALIAGYAEHGCGEEALNYFNQMQREGLSPNAVTFVCVLKACGNIGGALKGQELHAQIVKGGLLETDIVVGNALVDMYARCGLLEKAQEVFNKLPFRNVVSWNMLIGGYVQQGHSEEALKWYERMRCEGFSPDAATFVCILKACGSIGAVDRGQEIHAEIAREGLLRKANMIGNVLVDMYAKCGALAKAQEVFEELPTGDVVPWNALISGYAHHGLGEEALNCFQQMQGESVLPDSITFISILKACGSIRAADKGQELHVQIVREGLLENNFFVGNALVDMYARCGLLAEAQQMFNNLPSKDVVSWTALISGYVDNGHGAEAFNCFEQMKREGHSPDAFTFVCMLRACGSINATDKGQEIHAEIMREGFFEKNVVVGSALVNMYATCGALAKAREVFEALPVRNLVSWTALIAGYAEHGHGEEALNCFESMQGEGLSPNAITFVCTLKACGIIGAVDKGEKIHAEIVRDGVLVKDIVVGNALVDMYAKCGALAKAQEVFDKLPVRNVVSWTALIAGYAEHGCSEEALNCFDRMQCQSLSPDAVALGCVLKACGTIAAKEKGQEIHFEIAREGWLGKNVMMDTAVVNMYAKCGALGKAQEVFDELPVRFVPLWNALVTGYAQRGKVDNVFNLFRRMVGEGIDPDVVTFTVVLNACSNSGLLDKGQMYFETMRTSYGIIPTLEHYSCMVDLFARAGRFDKAAAVIKKMPFSANLEMWHSVLGACQKWGNVKLGRFAFEHAVQLDEKDAAAYSCMRNIFTAAGMQEDADMIEAMREKGSMGNSRTLGVD